VPVPVHVTVKLVPPLVLLLELELLLLALLELLLLALLELLLELVLLELLELLCEVLELLLLTLLELLAASMPESTADDDELECDVEVEVAPVSVLASMPTSTLVASDASPASSPPLPPV
jgi:hypothetical protein